MVGYTKRYAHISQRRIVTCAYLSLLSYFKLRYAGSIRMNSCEVTTFQYLNNILVSANTLQSLTQEFYFSLTCLNTTILLHQYVRALKLFWWTTSFTAIFSPATISSCMCLIYSSKMWIIPKVIRRVKFIQCFIETGCWANEEVLNIEEMKV